MKTRWIGVAAVLTLVLLLASCGTIKSPDESVLLKQLPQKVLKFEIDGEQYTSTAAQLTIEKQQTEKNSDTAYCKVVCENDVIDRTLYLILYSEYDNKQWNITDVQEYQSAEIRIKVPPITLDEGKTQVENEGYTDITSVRDCSDLKNNEYCYQYSVYEDHENLTVEGNVWIEGSVLDYGLGNYGWQYDSWNDISQNWKLTGTWYNAANGDTISIAEDDTYLTMTYSFDLVDGSRESTVGQKEKQKIADYNEKLHEKDQYTIGITTSKGRGATYEVKMWLYPDAAKGGRGGKFYTVKRAS